MRRLFVLAAAAAFALSSSFVLPAAADEGLSEQGYQDFLPQLRGEALAAGVSRSTVERVFPTLNFSSRTIELDRAQPGGPAGNPAVPPFAPYYREHVTAQLIAKGAARYAENGAALREIGRRYGVEPSILVAIWGHESSYGVATGDFDLLNSLSTLAYEGRRRQLFADEFIATLKLVDRGISRSVLKGSWAGATGAPQFLPSTYLRLAVDADGNGVPDIWNSQPDTLASIANYLRNAGWKPNVPWGVRATIPASLQREAVRSRVAAPRCPRVYQRHSRWLTMAEWRRLGVVPQGGNLPRDGELVSLLEPDGPGAPGYLLTTNYRVILDYNCSNFYALSVGLLADAIAR